MVSDCQRFQAAPMENDARPTGHTIHNAGLSVRLALRISAKTQKDSFHSDLPKLPQLSGSFGVGRTAFDWIDPNRGGGYGRRSRPAQRTDGLRLVPDASHGQGSQGHPVSRRKGRSTPLRVCLGFAQGETVRRQLALCRLRCNYVSRIGQCADCEDPEDIPRGFFSPGAFGTSFQYSSTIEDLVSHGYVVAAIEHTSEVFGVVFLDGKVHVYSPARIPKRAVPSPASTKEEFEAKLEEWYRHNVDVRAADISFVLDKLIELNRASKVASQFSQRLDLDHVGIVGHSRGGWAAIVACRRDERLKACVSEDGNAGGQGLQYPGAPVPRQPILYVEVSPVLKPGTTPDDWIVLKQLHNS